MRKNAFLAMILICGSFLAAQTAPPEPEFDNVFTALVDGKLVPIEKQNATLHAGGGGFIVAGAKASYIINGEKSPVRFSSSQAVEFVVRTPLAATNADPSTLFSLHRLETKKKNRELQFMSGHFSPVGGSFSTNQSQNLVPVTFSKYGSGSIKIKADKLPPGEYALSYISPQVVYCFGID